ncbi:transposase [Actinoallomurus sp. NBC_01490]|uniref:transposase n=1 Tax=Actinoallomurus sp. NBC_01490 TaxID=2903557 RepID=UPI003FA40536
MCGAVINDGVTRRVRLLGAAYGVRYHMLRCRKHRRPVLGVRVGTRPKQPLHTRADEHARQITAFQMVPDRVGLFVMARLKHSPVSVASQFKCSISHHFGTKFAVSRSHVPIAWSRSCFVAAVGVSEGDGPAVRSGTV